MKSVAVINESICIGCTKCIQACPTDAILGTSKHMHTVITDECISCNLCIPPCPVDCIEMVEVVIEKREKSYIQNRIKNRKHRLKLREEFIYKDPTEELEDRKAYIRNAITRENTKNRMRIKP